DFDKPNASYNTCITVGENVNTNILINLKSGNFSFSACRVDVLKNAHVNLMFLCNFDKNSTNFMQFDVNLNDFAQVNTYFINFGSEISVANYHANLNGENSTNNLYSIYLGKNSNKLDLNYHMDVYGKNSRAIIKVIGALQDNADKHFKGTINLHKGCTKSVGDEIEECLMLSNTAHSIAMPNILCDEEDVDGKHATSVGKVDDKILFYLMSRGLTYKESIMLVVNAGFQNIVSLIPSVFPTINILKQITKELNYEN
ncbi:MAG: SufD family Fe-S cluster assembly protein, partial [Clostridia bacterium]|nr:SufD family Fe-S cluster assembly protein [Clostridia bacterium]